MGAHTTPTPYTLYPRVSESGLSSDWGSASNGLRGVRQMQYFWGCGRHSRASGVPTWIGVRGVSHADAPADGGAS